MLSQNARSQFRYLALEYIRMARQLRRVAKTTEILPLRVKVQRAELSVTKHALGFRDAAHGCKTLQELGI